MLFLILQKFSFNQVVSKCHNSVEYLVITFLILFSHHIHSKCLYFCPTNLCNFYPCLWILVYLHFLQIKSLQ